ncbi:MAG: AbrB/MazE/SpoVT family DNA-binding domain-containing protein [Candidatus Schekmanbacteria bacterium]|nr:AbrB/MazE/SpoVT family DNA-binding domain-containing protein [Candidatus Schekmanbacteria bacterium]
MPIVKTSIKGQVVIPKIIREHLGIKSGGKIMLKLVGNHAEITSLPADPIKYLRGILKGKVSLADELLEERKKDNEIDEKNCI